MNETLLEKLYKELRIANVLAIQKEAYALGEISKEEYTKYLYSAWAVEERQGGIR